MFLVTLISGGGKDSDEDGHGWGWSDDQIICELLMSTSVKNGISGN